jgi:hypothetical protein
VDLRIIEHPGHCIQGVDLHDASTRKQPRSAHAFVCSALVHPEKAHDPIPHRLEPFVTRALETETHPNCTPGQALVETVAQARADAIRFKAALLDAEFTAADTLKQLGLAGVAVIGRSRTDVIVTFEGERIRVRDLAERFADGVEGAMGVGGGAPVVQARTARKVLSCEQEAELFVGCVSGLSVCFSALACEFGVWRVFLVWLERFRCLGVSWRVAQARVAERGRLRVLTGVERWLA